jgi:hypothetical protein
LRRRVISTPLATARLARWFLSVATPVYGQIAATMIDSMRNETIVRSASAADLFDIQPRGLTAAIERALRNEDHEYAETRWSDALTTEAEHWGGARFGRRRVFTRSIAVALPPDQAFAPIRRIGGRTGWYSGNWFWFLRGLLDTMRGGVGLRRGRRDPDDLRVGDTIDFWRVERLERNRRLLLRAEMKIPGRLWLQFELEDNRGRTLVQQTTIFDPAGYLGNAYWYALYPVHRSIFAGMLTGIERAIHARAPCSRSGCPGPIL